VIVLALYLRAVISKEKHKINKNNTCNKILTIKKTKTVLESPFQGNLKRVLVNIP
jgi:hypothetical protein